MRFKIRHDFVKKLCSVFVFLFIIGAVGQAVALDKESLRLEWSLTGFQLPYYWAKTKGYYAKEGIDLEIKEGAGSGKTVNLLGANKDTVGFAGYMIMAKAIAKGMPIKGVYCIVQQSPFAVISFEKNAIRKPKDLIGRSVATIASHKTMLDLFLKIHNIPAEKVIVRVTGSRTRNTLFAQGKVDGIVSITIGSPLDFVILARQGKGDPVHFLNFADWGLKMLGYGLFVHRETLSKKQDFIRRFLKATTRGWQESAKNVDETVRIALQCAPGNEKRAESVKLQFQETLKLLHTPNTKNKPLGWVSNKDLSTSQDVLINTGAISEKLPLDRYHTNEFITK